MENSPLEIILVNLEGAEAENSLRLGPVKAEFE